MRLPWHLAKSGGRRLSQTQIQAAILAILDGVTLLELAQQGSTAAARPLLPKLINGAPPKRKAAYKPPG